MSSPQQVSKDELQSTMHSIIQRIATGPELSKDISQEEARLGMRAILEEAVDPVQAGIFFIALRMKRETWDENKGILDGIRDNVTQVTADVEEVLDIADPYDGYNRTLPSSPFLPALLAECGVPTVSHGLDKVGPKYGITHRHVMQAAGVNVDLSVEDAAKRLSDPETGWCYIDQAVYCKPLHDIIPLRTKIIKRQVVTTVEVLTKPISGRSKTHFMTGYVHKPYPPIYAMLARHVGFDSCLLMRGVEGGVVPSLRQVGKYFQYHDLGEEIGIEIEPTDLGIHQEVRGVPFPADLPKKHNADKIEIAVDIEATANAAAKAGLAALNGEKGATYDSLIYAGAITLHHLKRFESERAAADHLRIVLDSGAAAKRVK